MTSGESKPVSKTTANGQINATAYCSFGQLSVSSEAATCDATYVPVAGPACAKNDCGGTVPSAGAHTESNASSQAVGNTWHYAASAGTCTFACSTGYSWDSGSSSCKADCTGLASDTHAGFGPYALSSIPSLVHGASASFSGTAAFGTSPANGGLTATFAYSCTDGVLAKNSTNGAGSCQANYAWNSSWSTPACTVDSFPVSGSFGASASGATVSGCAGKTATATSTGAFSFGNVDYGTVCNDVTAVRTGHACTTVANGPASLAAAVSNVSGNCILSAYSVSGSFGALAAGAQISGCAGKTATADASGNFSFSGVVHGTDCSSIAAVRPGYSCSTSANGPASIASAFSSVSGSCSQNVQTLAGSIRFNGTNASLSRTPTTASGQDKWTYSVWVKRSSVG
jgi:hypothetical protein